MKIIALLFMIVSFISAGPCSAADRWTGVDETVVEKYAMEAGRPPCDPFINTDQGDLLLFVFLTAGAIGGFAGGYYFRELFPPRRKRELEDV